MLGDDGPDERRASSERLLDGGGRVTGDQQHPDRAAAQRLGAEVVVLGRLVRDPERRLADHELLLKRIHDGEPPEDVAEDEEKA